MAAAVSVYEVVEFDFNDKRARTVCDGPEGPSLLTALYNYYQLYLVKFGHVKGKAPPYREKHELQQALRATLKLNMAPKNNTMNDSTRLEACLAVMDILGAEHHVTPLLNSVTSFEDSSTIDLLELLGVLFLHGWLVNPEDAIIYPYVQNYSYEKLQKYSLVLDGLKEEPSAIDRGVLRKRALVQGLLDAEKQLTEYGYVTLCRMLPEGEVAVLYWDSKFHIIHKHAGNLLLLVTDSNILREYPAVRWRVFEEVHRENIYLTNHYFPADGQPNFERAKSWYQSKVSRKNGKVPDSVTDEGSSETLLSRSKKKRLRQRLAREAAKKEAKALNKQVFGEDHQEASRAAPAVSEENRSQLTPDGNKDSLASKASRVSSVGEGEASNEQASGEDRQEASKAAPTASDDNPQAYNSSQVSTVDLGCCSREAAKREGEASNKQSFGDDRQEASNTIPAASDDKLDDSGCSTAEEKRSKKIQQDGNKDHEAAKSLQQSVQSHLSVCGTSSHTIAKDDENKSTVGGDFLNFLLEFNDGESRFKDGSNTERVPFFEGIVEALKYTGSTKFYVPFKFIQMYDRSLAMTIQDSYPRIYEDLTESVRLYLVKHGVDIAAQLEILHLPEPRLNAKTDLRTNILI